MPTRREFLIGCGAVGAGLVLGGRFERVLADSEFTLSDLHGEEKKVTLPDGFTPDPNLKLHTLPDGFGEILQLPANTADFANFEQALNTAGPDGTPPLAGYDQSLEGGDYCHNPDHQCLAQLNMFSWKVFTGEEVVIPGVGTIEGGLNRAVMVVLLNRDGSVHAWDETPLVVKHGFTAGGPIWDGEKNIDKTELGLVAHFADRLFQGVPGYYQGACNNPDNCGEVLVVSAQRRQFGFNPDGSERIPFELLRAEIVSKTS